MITKGFLHGDLSKIRLGIIVLLSSLVGGYIIEDYPKQFLDLFKVPFVQWLAFVVLNLAARLNEPRSRKLMAWVAIESALFVALIQGLKQILRQIYGEQSPSLRPPL